MLFAFAFALKHFDALRHKRKIESAWYGALVKLVGECVVLVGVMV